MLNSATNYYHSFATELSEKYKDNGTSIQILNSNGDPNIVDLHNYND